MFENKDLNNNIWSKWFECQCHTEGVMLSRIFDEIADEPKTIYLAMFRNGSDGKLGWKERFRWCLNMLINGRPYLDEVMLDQKTAGELGNALVDFSNKGKSNEK